MSRIAMASMTGTVVEFYDFIIFSTAAALVFSTVFFPELGAASGTAVSIATTGVAFVARPLGAVIFGHFGDRLGRKTTLVSTLMLMGLATVGIGLVPTANTIGVAAPIILVLFRVLQGLAVGGEWAGATLLANENAPTHLRGRYSLYPQMGPSVAFALASATFLIIALTMSSEAFVAWGWRIPFLLSGILVVVGLYVRLKIEESNDFKDTVRRKQVVAVPLAETFRSQGREVVLGAVAVMTPFAFFYMGVAYLTSYGTVQLGLERTTILTMGIFGGLAFAATTIIGSVASDRTGRKAMIVLGSTLSAVTGLVLFPILDVGTPIAFLIGLCLTTGCMGFAYGPAGAMLPELFETRYRYTGAGVAYSLAGVLGGALAPNIAVKLESAYGSYSVGIMLTVIGALSAVATLVLRETKTSSVPGSASVAPAS